MNIKDFIEEIKIKGTTTQKKNFVSGVKGFEPKKCVGKDPIVYTSVEIFIENAQKGDIIAGKMTSVSKNIVFYFGRGQVKKIWLNPTTKHKNVIFTISKDQDMFINVDSFKNMLCYVWTGNQIMQEEVNFDALVI